MLATERAMRKEISDGLDCAATASRLMLLRAELTQSVAERRTLGDLTPIGVPDLRKPRPASRMPAADIGPALRSKRAA